MSAVGATTRGGIVLRVEDTLFFVPADVAVKVAPPPRIARVAGAPSEVLGIALHEGQIMPVLSLGDARDCMVVCDHQGELIGLVGASVLGTGMFEPCAHAPDCVSFAEGVASPLDLAAMYLRVQAGGWLGRWGA